VAEPDSTAQIITDTARLPLALAIVGARAATSPDRPLHTLATELRDPDRLTALAGGDPGSDIRVVFSWSYRALAPAAARLFPLLGLHPGPAVSVAAAASLAGVGVAEIRPALADLVRAHLLVERSPGRFGLHDLLRAYAIDLVAAGEAGDSEDQRAARHRMLDHYRHSAFAAAVMLEPRRHRITCPDPRPGVIIDSPADEAAAQSWLTTEYPVLLAAIDYAVRYGFDEHVWQLAWTLVGHGDRQGYWQDLEAAEIAAIAAARRLGDPAAQAFGHRNLAKMLVRLGRLDEAEEHLDHAVELSQRIGDDVALGRIHIAQADVSVERGQWQVALGHNRKALERFQAIGHHHGQASALNNIGWVLAQLGEQQQAIAVIEQAMPLFVAEGDLEYQAASWHSLGYAHHQLGRPADAIACYTRAVELCRQVGHRFHEALTLADLADAHLSAAEPAAARLCLQYALAALETLGHPMAGSVRDRLAALPVDVIEELVPEPS
jgi:tetratricopeptide (TPR) repeat protein